MVHQTGASRLTEIHCWNLQRDLNTNRKILWQALLPDQLRISASAPDSKQTKQNLGPDFFRKSEIIFFKKHGASNGCKSTYWIHCWNLQRGLNTNSHWVCKALLPDQLRNGASAPDSKQTNQNLGPDFFILSEIEFLVSDKPAQNTYRP